MSQDKEPSFLSLLRAGLKVRAREDLYVWPLLLGMFFLSPILLLATIVGSPVYSLIQSGREAKGLPTSPNPVLDHDGFLSALVLFSLLSIGFFWGPLAANLP